MRRRLNTIVSIVVAVKSDLARLQRFVEAMLVSKSERVELIIVDGGSRDGTAEWLAALANSSRRIDFVTLSEVDSGIAEAWNRGVRVARGEWVVFLGVDDHIADAAAWRAAIDRLGSLPPGCGVAAFSVRMMTPGGAIVADEQPRLGEGGRKFPAVNAIPHQGVFHRRSLWESYGDFDSSFAIAADYEFLLRVWEGGVEIQACGGSPPVSMTFGGVSKRSPLVNVREFRRARQLHGIRRSPLSECLEWSYAALRFAVANILGESISHRLADGVRRLRGLPPVWGVP